MDSPPLTAEDLGRVRNWFRSEARAYPWTQTEDPYAIWISEIMLQQTVVTAVVLPFERWMARWPNVASLAAADEADVLRAWEGLGYATRAKNLHRAARLLVARGQNSLPSAETELRELPGVGEYTTAAIRSFAFHQPALTLDANLKRVFQRLDGSPFWTPEVEGRWRLIWAELVDGPSSRESNQAIMQLGQRVCRSRAPRCELCPLSTGCRAKLTGRIDSIPEPKARTLVEKATTVIFWHREQKSQWWLARPRVGRFSNLWLAPAIEPSRLRALSPEARELSGRLHTYTKYRDRLSPFAALWDEAVDPPCGEGWEGRWASVAETRALGMVSAYRRILEEAQENTLL